MREILFRGKRKSDGKWLYGYYSDDKVYETHFPCIFPLVEYEDDEDWAILPETVGQFTGVMDKNSKKIFEGDIVKGRWKSNKAIQIFLVRYKNGCFAFDNNCISGTYEDVYDLQVIGNSYDNPKSIGGVEK